tara:strand:+ start:18 stop:734 length:717 start_codon:yes stop_codon:yes gene_type:complete
MKRLCTICARGGSKGYKNKNIKNLLGKPLIAHSIIQAKSSELFDCIAVSSDSNKILDIAKKWGADLLIKRPPKLAEDDAPKLPSIKHCVIEAEKKSKQVFDTIADLDSTSPLRIFKDIYGAIKLLEEKGISNVVTAAPAFRSPYYNLLELSVNGFARKSKLLKSSILRRQQSPKCYDANASVYVWKRDALFEKFSETSIIEDTMLYIMPVERSRDIDGPLDFEIVEFLMKRKSENYNY